uniref:Uncharacterized protein n=1 Tax=Paramoeba aestuarina TaxID=180227 RepID=A0A7S4NER3_9EUKA
MAFCSLAISFTGCIALLTHHWSSIEISEEETTPLTTATGGYNLKGSYNAGLFQFCMKNPSDGHYRTCYGITMPMDFTCQGPSGDIVRTGNELYMRLTCIRVFMIAGILFALASCILSAIGGFKKRQRIYLWCAFALAFCQVGFFTSACGLYGHTEAYWYKCGHNQCGGVFRCLFSFGYSYGLAVVCMLLSFFVLGYLFSMRRGLAVYETIKAHHSKKHTPAQESLKKPASSYGSMFSAPFQSLKNIKGSSKQEPSPLTKNLVNHTNKIENKTEPASKEVDAQHVVHIDAEDSVSSASQSDSSSNEE